MGKKKPPHSYDLRSRKDVTWIPSENKPLPGDGDGSDDSSYVDSEQEDLVSDEEDLMSDEEDEEEDEEELTEEDHRMLHDIARAMGGTYNGKGTILSSSTVNDSEQHKFTPTESRYFTALPADDKEFLLKHLAEIEASAGNVKCPYKFALLKCKAPLHVKSDILRKIKSLGGCRDSKIETWVENVLRLPFDTYVPMMHEFSKNPKECSAFLVETKKILNTATYGMESAKLQILEMVAQWMSNPQSGGNCIAMCGPAGVGKTAFARKGIAQALKRPFIFISLAGVSDSAQFIGHSFTYEGAIHGRIADALMHAKCLNPVFYFDELDKISSTMSGQEVENLLIHLTDPEQNAKFVDRYFAGIDIDLSKALFIFSLNDAELLNPILKDRLKVIACGGYTPAEKKTILIDYTWKEQCASIGIDIPITDEAVEYIVDSYSNDEKGMRTLIRVVRTILSRLNILRMIQDTSEYKFAIPIPKTLESSHIKKLMIDFVPKEPESWMSMYN